MYYYYHTIVGLEPLLIFLVVAINTVWASLNDPLIGFLTDRNFKWTKKWGRRFPWIAIGFIPQSLSLIMIFSTPTLDPANPWPVVVWFLVSLFLFDLFITLVDIHVSILRADKFRTERERRKYAGFWGFFDMIAQVLGMNRDDIRVIHMDGPGCYGHNGADDAAMDAALLAREVPGHPVSLKWMRDDENAWEPYGPAMIMETQASLDKDGNVMDWNFAFAT